MAERSTNGHMPTDHFIASMLGRTLYAMAKEKDAGWGLDIKTQVTMDGGRVIEVIVAIPCLTDEDQREAEEFVKSQFPFDTPTVIVNGTGRYVRHSAQGDCGTTGRKLAVDFYGGNCRIGGGSPWTKDGSKADVALNILARHYALLWLSSNREKNYEKVYCAISCCIGKRHIRVAWYDEKMNELASDRQPMGVEDVSRLFRLKEPIYCELCREGLFSKVK